MNQETIKNKTKRAKILMYLLLIVFVLSSLLVVTKWMTKVSFGSDINTIHLEAHLDKYINYELEGEKETLVQYSLSQRVSQEENEQEIKNTKLQIKVNQIDGKNPSRIKVIERLSGKEKESTYSQEEGNIEIIENSPKEENKYIIMCYYETKIENNLKTELNLEVKAEVEVAKENRSHLIEEEKSYQVEVEENIGDLTSITSQTQEIYDGYIRANQTYGTQYETKYQEKQTVTISQKDLQEKLAITQNNSFVKGEENEEEENNNQLIYKSTKIKKDNLENLLGEEGTLEILDKEQNPIEIINQETNWEEDGTYTINYLEEQEAIILKTSKIQKEGILDLEHTKIIKSTWLDNNNRKIKTTTNLVGIREETILDEERKELQEYIKENEKIIPIQEATTNVTMELSQNQWTNQQQNEITLDILLKAKDEKDKLFKNPSFIIELPQEVEKVILQNSSIFYGNGLEIKNTTTRTNENGKIEVIVDLEGEQNKYNESEIDLSTELKITATIILRKDLKDSKEAMAKLTYTNEYTMTQNKEIESKEYLIDIENYREEKITKEEQLQEIENNNTTTQTIENQGNLDGLKLEVIPVKGEKNLVDGDTLYEGEYIKYNIKITNVKEEAIDHVKIIGNVPEGTTYGELDADYHQSAGKYEYHFVEELKSKEIEIGTLKPKESKNIFYEVQVNDLEEEKEELVTNTEIKAYIGEEEASCYELKNTIKKAELKVFMKSYLYALRDTWNYYVHVTSKEDKKVKVTMKLPKEIDPQYVFNKSTKEEELRYTEENKPKDNIFVLELNTNTDYYINGVFDALKLEKQTEESKIELTATATAEGTNEIYYSNENRVIFEYDNVTISMTSSKEGEEIKYEEEIDYEVKIRNIGKTNYDDPRYYGVNVNLKDILPENVQPISVTYDNWKREVEEEKEGEVVKSIFATGEFTKLEPVTQEITTKKDPEGNRLPNVNIDFLIPYQEEVTIQIKAKAGAVDEKTKIENRATVSGEYIISKTSNIVTHTILPFDYVEPEEPDNPDKPVDPEEPDKPVDPEDPDKPVDPEDPDKPVDPEDPDKPEEQYAIAGFAWLDENEDGERQGTEKGLDNITVTLVDTKNTNQIKETVQTTTRGSYHFSDLTKGNYLILFQYDTNRYRVTEYQKNGVASNLNSDAINKQITLNGKTVSVGIIEVSNLDKDTSNLDIGLVENKVCNLKIDKSITKVSVKTNKGTKQYNYNGEKLVKTEIRAKEIEGAIVTVEYKILVTNDGEITTTVGKIVDELPEGFTLATRF